MICMQDEEGMCFLLRKHAIVLLFLMSATEYPNLAVMLGYSKRVGIPVVGSDPSRSSVLGD
jgi:hypothetical protein